MGLLNGGWGCSSTASGGGGRSGERLNDGGVGRGGVRVTSRGVKVLRQGLGRGSQEQGETDLKDI